MFRFWLTHVTACALLSQHGISDAVAQGLEAHGVAVAGFIIESMARNGHDTVARMHHIVRHAGHALGMTGTTCARGIGEVSRKGYQTCVRGLLGLTAGVTRVTGDTGSRCESVYRVESGLLGGMALYAVIAGRLTLVGGRLPQQQNYYQQTRRKR
jgi:hypothetical protein